MDGTSFGRRQTRRERAGELGAGSAHLVAMTEASDEPIVELLPVGRAAAAVSAAAPDEAAQVAFSVELAAARPLRHLSAQLPCWCDRSDQRGWPAKDIGAASRDHRGACTRTPSSALRHLHMNLDHLAQNVSTC